MAFFSLQNPSLILQEGPNQVYFLVETLNNQILYMVLLNPRGGEFSKGGQNDCTPHKKACCLELTLIYLLAIK